MQERNNFTLITQQFLNGKWFKTQKTNQKIVLTCFMSQEIKNITN